MITLALKLTLTYKCHIQYLRVCNYSLLIGLCRCFCKYKLFNSNLQLECKYLGSGVVSGTSSLQFVS